MREPPSSDYHDYVIKDGRLIGKFDEMYLHSAEVPWHQDTTAFGTFSQIDIDILRRNRYDRICEVGCGLGYFANRLLWELPPSGDGRPSVTAIDISPTAIGKARGLFPGIDFQVADIRQGPFQQDFDLVVCKDIMWYVFPQLEQVIRHLSAMITADGWLFVSQSFPEKEDFLGKEVIPDPFALRDIFTLTYALDFFCIEWDVRYGGRPLAHLLLRKAG